MTDSQYILLFEAITAVATLAVPVVVVVLASRFDNQIKRWEANQWRNQELIKARLDYYKVLVPKLNDVMCYFTFIGSWKETTPPDAVAVKRALDREFYCAAPLFGEHVQQAYSAFMERCYETFGQWGTDARLRTGFGRRKTAAGSSWKTEWDEMFAYDGTRLITDHELTGIRDSYSALIASFAADIELNAARDRYVSVDVSPNAH